MKQRTALVTGSTRGIGKGIARRLAKEGVHVVVTGWDANRGKEVVELIRAEVSQADFVMADLATSAEAARALAAESLSVLG